VPGQAATRDLIQPRDARRHLLQLAIRLLVWTSSGWRVNRSWGHTEPCLRRRESAMGQTLPLASEAQELPCQVIT
jgi:hypothetical protein